VFIPVDFKDIASYPQVLRALKHHKLVIKWDYSQFVKDYNRGTSTQVPVRKFFVVKDRFSSKYERSREVL
jgi:hypothetical protein